MEATGQINTLVALATTSTLMHILDKRQGWTHSLDGHCGEQKILLLPPDLPISRPNSPSLVECSTLIPSYP